MEKVKLYKGKVIVEYDDEKHKYLVNGKETINVTMATSKLDKSGPLMGWVAKLMAGYLQDRLEKGEEITLDILEQAKKHYREVSKEARDIGEETHKWIQDWIKGLNPEIPESDEVRSCITAFLKWQKEYKAKFLASEKIVYSKKYDYVGRLDAIARIQKGIGQIKRGLYIIDWKSSSGIYSEHFYQSAGYQQAEQEESGKKYDGRILIQFGKYDGQFNFRVATEFKKDLEAFLGLLAVKRREDSLAYYGF
jgi:hypothetical protein